MGVRARFEATVAMAELGTLDLPSLVASIGYRAGPIP